MTTSGGCVTAKAQRAEQVRVMVAPDAMDDLLAPCLLLIGIGFGDEVFTRLPLKRFAVECHRWRCAIILSGDIAVSGRVCCDAPELVPNAPYPLPARTPVKEN